MLLAIAGCQSPLAKTQKPDAPKELRTGLGKAIQLQLTGIRQAQEILAQYLDVSSEVSRSANGLLSSEAFVALGERLPADLSALTRTIPAGTTRSAEVTTTSLDVELETLITAYQSQLDALVPDPMLAKTLPFVHIDDQGLHISDDEVVPLNTLSGILMVEALNAQAQGVIPEEFAELVAADYLALQVAEPDVRGMYLIEAKDHKWDGGTVRYWFADGVSSNHKDLVEDAMDDWETRLGTTIEFKQQTKGAWEVFCRTIGAFRVLEIVDDAKLTGMGATESPSLNKLTINSKQGDEDYLFTAKHELGHVLGLTHEHQRADRDSYVTIPGYKQPTGGIFATVQDVYYADYAKYEEKKWVGGWRYKKWGWLPYWYWDSTYKQVQFSVLEGPFDYHSIMLYSSNQVPGVVSKQKIPAVLDPVSLESFPESDVWPGMGFSIHQRSLFITPGDAATVKRLYK